MSNRNKASENDIASRAHQHATIKCRDNLLQYIKSGAINSVEDIVQILEERFVENILASMGTPIYKSQPSRDVVRPAVYQFTPDLPIVGTPIGHFGSTATTPPPTPRLTPKPVPKPAPKPKSPPPAAPKKSPYAICKQILGREVSVEEYKHLISDSGFKKLLENRPDLTPEEIDPTTQEMIDGLVSGYDRPSTRPDSPMSMLSLPMSRHWICSNIDENDRAGIKDVLMSLKGMRGRTFLEHQGAYYYVNGLKVSSVDIEDIIIPQDPNTQAAQILDTTLFDKIDPNHCPTKLKPGYTWAAEKSRSNAPSCVIDDTDTIGPKVIWVESTSSLACPFIFIRIQFYWESRSSREVSCRLETWDPDMEPEVSTIGVSFDSINVESIQHKVLALVNPNTIGENELTGAVNQEQDLDEDDG